MNLPTGSQQQAVEARGNVIVVAGAGTGKTSTLVRRCLALLEEGCSLENILMVTFTDAAAVEMRRRIREALQSRLDAADQDAGQANQREHFQKQLALLDAAPISTLHGFCLQLVREHFYELGIDPDVNVLTEQQIQPIIQQLLDLIFEHHYAGKSVLDPAVKKLVRSEGRGSDEQIRALMLKLHRYSQTLAAPESWFKSQQTIFQQGEPDAWREWFLDGFVAWKKSWQPDLLTFAGNPAVNLTLAALQLAPEGPSFDQAAETLRAIRSADEDKANWPRGSVGKVRNHLKAFFDEAEFLASLTAKNGNDPLAEDWELVRHDMMALLDLTLEFTAEFSRTKREAGGVDFADLEQFALRLLRDPQTGEATQTALRWRQQLHHVFVDEYQDINAAQDSILSALSREGEAANRFLVGDVKQSIYRFRLSNPAIFRNYETRWSSGEGWSRRIPLSENFRSRQRILDFVNPLFHALMREEIGSVAYESLNFGNPTERAALTRSGNEAPRVEFHLIAKGDQNHESEGDNGEETPENSDVSDLLATEREARLIGLRLRELMEQRHEIWDKDSKQFRPVKWGDMAVLLRSPASRVEAFAKEFAVLEIPLEAARGGFFDSLEISDLVCLLKLLDNPLQDIPLLAVLHSPLVGMTLAEMAEIRASEKPDNRAKNFWLAAQHFRKRGDKTSAAWLKLDLFIGQMERWRELVRQSSVSQCLETALAETHYEALLRAGPRGEQKAANIRRLLDLARDYDPYQRQGLFRFIRFIKAQEELDADMDAVPENRDAVRLTSIHKSKGLEFPVVVVAGLGWSFNFRDLRESILLDEQYGLCPKITLALGGPLYPSLPYWLARRRQQRELLGEELRLLYVAMTRARDTLVLTATSAARSDPRWAAIETQRLDERELLSARCYLDWLKLWLPQVTRDDDWQNDRKGRNSLLNWRIYEETDLRFRLPDKVSETQTSDPGRGPFATDTDLDELSRRMSWKYPFSAATAQRAKTSVTELRRQSDEEEAEEARFIRRNVFAVSTRGGQKLTAAEVGTAHHRFLQRISLSKTGSVADLRDEADRMRTEQWLGEPEVESLDLAAIAQFWESEFGRSIAAHADAVQRELQFTARLRASDLVHAKLEPPARLAPDEFVVVQGMVDLAVLLPDEIWILDYKTDAMTVEEVPGKVAVYEPQLRIYAMALGRIYGKTVTDCRLHFMSCGKSARMTIDAEAKR